MYFRAVGTRCAVDINALHLPISDEMALTILMQKGFQLVNVDVVMLARSRVGKSTYRRGARTHEGPDTFDCSSLMKWLYAQKGIWLPRRSIQQRQACIRVATDQLIAGDLVFTSGYIDYFDTDPGDGVGHVGLATGSSTIIHAANSKVGIIESPIETFVGNDAFRGIGRIIPAAMDVRTFACPVGREIESSDDIRWVILQNLPHR